MTCDSSRGMAMCHALKVFPRNFISSEGILGWGWLRLIPSSRACSTARCTRLRLQVKASGLQLVAGPCAAWHLGCDAPTKVDAAQSLTVHVTGDHIRRQQGQVVMPSGHAVAQAR